ncbi:chemotaxis protein CheX [Spongisporangium articulatum]|uniref:Chemotaxis protein CheX n=1 Tax=Spongisporangium articulatum TaxID=3362603 RepID=A0ABW8AKP3_9ACTN
MTVLTDLSEWEGLETDLEAILTDVLSSILGEEVLPAWEPAPPGEQALTRLAIHDLRGDGYVEIEILVPMALAKVVAARMLGVAQPLDDDIVDAVAELGNIAGGNVKSVLFEHSRLSLPLPRFELSGGETDRHPEGLVARAAVNGLVAELAVYPVAAALGLQWPPHPETDSDMESAQ